MNAMAIREVVFDIETIGDIRDFDNLKITVVSIFDYSSGKTISYTESELKDLWPIFEKSDRLIGFNSEHFDIPILNRYYAGDLCKFAHLDLLKVIKDATGSRYKLNDIAKATLQMEKSGDGLMAMKWWDEGKVDLVKKYCEKDVLITKEIYEYGLKNKMLYYPKLTGEIAPFPVNFDATPETVGPQNLAAVNASVNLTLPF